ncbi:MAG TPA: 4-hydroxythreonine-4-phosphate dehydrogenase PdxA [Patescibacteria group bacterium]|nr:4-hydroxythreonine-4-phosphate dehydrogenase PdxA [Patescibacteria group bacterium]
MQAQDYDRPLLAITMGDAAGCGPEIIMKALAAEDIYRRCRPLVFGDTGRLRQAALLVKSTLLVRSVITSAHGSFEHGMVDVLDFANIPTNLPFGKISPLAGHAAFQYIEEAVRQAMDKEVAAVVTAPVNREALQQGGHHYPGHAEILAALSNADDCVVLLVGDRLKVIHVTAHVPMVEAAAFIKKDRIFRVIRLADRMLRLLGISRPRIAVAGFNAHAGENGLLGREEIEEIVPAIEAARQEKINALGPISPDVVFFRAACRKEYDIVVAMYHDQGHIPVKMLGFDDGINVTVGLPFVQTSVDHGTAFDIAGQGTADRRSMTAALDFAIRLVSGSPR